MTRSMLGRVDSAIRANPWWVVALLVLVGSYLRFFNMGELGFRWDEDLSSLAVKAILEHGVPELPSGMVYLRSGIFLYVMAASAQVFGFSEWALRLPAALFSIATIPLAFVFARRLFGSTVGLLLAALLTFSFWDIEFARYARMYAPFEFFYLLTIFCIWRYRVVEESLPGGLLCVGLALLSVSLHQLGYTLGLAFLVPLVLQGRRITSEPMRLVFPVVACSVVAGFYFAWKEVVSHFFRTAARGVSDRLDAGPGSELPVAGDTGGGLSDLVQMIGSNIPLRVPDLSLVSELWSSFAVAGILFLAASLAAVSWFARSRAMSLNTASFVLLVCVTASCVLGLFNLALIGIIALAFLKSEGLAGFRGDDVRFATVVTGVSFAVWLGLTIGLDLGAHAQEGAGRALRMSVRDLLDFPGFFVFWGFVNESPLMSITALVGGLWAFDRTARQSRDPAALFLILVFSLHVVVNGLFDTLFEQFRYNVPFYPLYFTFVALGLTKWVEVLAAGRGLAPEALTFGRPVTALGTAVLAAFVVAVDVNPVRSVLVSQRGYHNDGALYRFFYLDRYPDFKTPAAFVAENATDREPVIVLDSREYYNYLGRADYWVRTAIYESQTYIDAGVRKDLYVSTPLIMDLEALKLTLDGAPGSTKWLIASDAMLANSRAISQDIKDFISSNDDRVVYVGLDGATKVYRFDTPKS